MWTIDNNGTLKLNETPVEQIKSNNTSGPFGATPKIAVIHFTAGGTARSSAEWFRHPGNTGSSAHVVIERDGTVIQCVSFKKVAWHAGKSRWRDLVGLNRHSFGIELANWGALRPSGGGWVTSTGKSIADPFIGVHRNGNPDGSTRPIGWEPYPQEQVEAAAGVVGALAAAYGVNEIVGHDDIAPVRKSDPGPAFSMTRFRQQVLNPRRDDGDNIGMVAVASGLNLRTGPGTGHPVITALPKGTKLQLLSAQGNWLEVSQLDAGGHPVLTGWVHGQYVSLD